MMSQQIRFTEIDLREHLLHKQLDLKYWLVNYTTDRNEALLIKDKHHDDTFYKLTVSSDNRTNKIQCINMTFIPEL